MTRHETPTKPTVRRSNYCLSSERSNVQGVTLWRADPRDSVFAYTESAANRTSIVTAYSFPEAGVPTDELIAWIARRAQQIPQLHQRLLRPFGDIGEAYWSDAPGFDARDHVHPLPELAWADLCTFLATLHDTDFAPDLPLWDAYVARNVVGAHCSHEPQIVVVLRFHHAMTDGLGSAEIARQLFSSRIGRYRPGRPVTRTHITALEVARLPLRPFLVAADLWRLTRAARLIRRHRSSGEWSAPDVAPRTCLLNGPVGDDRAADIVFWRLPQLRAAADAIGGVSVNDLVLGAVGGAVADHLGESAPLLAAVPVSVRRTAGPDSRNAVATGVVRLHHHLPPCARARAVHREVTAERRRFALAGFAELSAASLPRLPGMAYALLGRVWQAAAARGCRPTLTQLKISTIPKGSADQWELCGLGVIANFGVSPITDGLAVNHTVSTIGDWLAIGVIADPDRFPDLDGYLDRLRRELASLCDEQQTG